MEFIAEERFIIDLDALFEGAGGDRQLDEVDGAERFLDDYEDGVFILCVDGTEAAIGHGICDIVEIDDDIAWCVCIELGDDSVQFPLTDEEFELCALEAE